MSITNLSSHQNNTFHWRNNSGELDVFEASNYFSSANDTRNPGYITETRPINVKQTAARLSLDIPMRKNPIPPEIFRALDQKQGKLETKKHKQPSSPGGRLASFLNSLFNQTHLKKKKSKSKSGKDSDFDDGNSPGGRRKRRSSISHFRINTNNNNNNNVSADDANTPIKSYRGFRNLSGQNRTTLQDEIYGEKKPADSAWMDKKYSRVPGRINLKSVFSNRKSVEFGKFIDDDDGGDSDSSSDLFDLPNHELDFYSSGLPVYETTHMDRIKIVTPISRVTTV
ncbi:hypothetical protein DH2020_049876 [Rehmannia glutinosa]|uniref:Protein BIG GRAIN 1-like E n=1 Tax=Rehmannia glutinosa TaxID=99300 RepID=A0ABR0U250_REHGL